MATWKEDIIKTYEVLGGSAPYSDVYVKIKEIRKEKFPKTWQAIIRQVVESNARDSENFKGDDIFYSVDGIGNGVWGLHKRRRANKRDN